MASRTAAGGRTFTVRAKQPVMAWGSSSPLSDANVDRLRSFREASSTGYIDGAA